jgi:hypothetical protein
MAERKTYRDQLNETAKQPLPEDMQKLVEKLRRVP